MPASLVRPGPGASVEIDVQVVPRASRSRVVGVHGDRLRVQLAAPPVDGAANEALVDLFADLLGLARSQVVLVRGATGKRKTLRVVGVDAPTVAARLSLADHPGSGGAHLLPLPLALTLALAGCGASVDVPLKVLLPEDHGDLDRADNATITLAPDDLSVNYGVDGTDFELSLELELDDVQRTLTLYLARGEELLAYGRSAPFVLADTGESLAIFLGRPGALSTFPGAIDTPDPQVLVAEAPGRGALLLGDDGGTYLLGERTLTVAAGSDFDPDGDLPAPDDGVLVGEASGGVIRLAFADTLRGWRFDPGEDRWDPLTFAGDLDLGPRPGAATLVDGPRSALLVLGGGASPTIAEVALLADDAGEYPVTLLDTPLDAPRPGARATWVLRSDGDDGEGVLLFGSDQDDLAAATFTATGEALGPLGRWTSAACAQVDVGDAATLAATLRVLCIGGDRGGAPSADALLLHIPPAGVDAPIAVDELPAWLPAPMPDPRLFADDGAIYAQSAGTWLRIDRGDLTQTEIPSAATRTRGGHSVLLGTGVTFLLGGMDADGDPVDRWQVYTPALP